MPHCHGFVPPRWPDGIDYAYQTSLQRDHNGRPNYGSLQGNYPCSLSASLYLSVVNGSQVSQGLFYTHTLGDSSRRPFVLHRAATRRLLRSPSATQDVILLEGRNRSPRFPGPITLHNNTGLPGSIILTKGRFWRFDVFCLETAFPGFVFSPLNPEPADSIDQEITSENTSSGSGWLCPGRRVVVICDETSVHGDDCADQAD